MDREELQGAFRDSAADLAALLERLVDEHLPAMVEASERLVSVLRAGGKILVCGNGGSAADAQHFAAELVGRFEVERRSLPAIALTTDTSLLTAVGNDYGFEQIFDRQVNALAAPGDALLAISTSGNSPNVLRAVEAARLRGCMVVGLTGRDGGELARVADVAIVVPATRTARIQECHQLIYHTICEAIDRAGPWDGKSLPPTT